MMKKSVLFPILLLTFSFVSLHAADNVNTEVTKKKTLSDTTGFYKNVDIAMSAPDYPITAGDTYKLTYNNGSSNVTQYITVDATYKMRISNVAIIDVAGKTFPVVKKQVEDIVARNYPMGGCQFALSSPSVFKIVIKGEVKDTAEGSAWPLSRLSTFVNQCVTEYSSVRDVKIISQNGRERVYDLFKAERYGDLSNDPYLRPGDVITVGRIKRVVKISGAVERPGNYELMRDENLKALIGYASGLTETANTSRITLRRSRDKENPSGIEVYLDSTVMETDYELFNADEILIEDYSDYMNSVVVEGAINAVISSHVDANGNVSTTTASKTTIKYYSGENYASFVRRTKDMFTSSSDLVNSYIQRNDVKIQLPIEKYLTNYSLMSEYLVEPDDKLVILSSSNRQTILITGEVKSVVELDAYPAQRLSALLDKNLTSYASTRNIQITSVDGVTKTYDLFLATRFGQMDQNPYVNAGETIVVKRFDRQVTISGAVERPGTYQLLPGENLETLVNYYGNGLTPTADPSHIEISRIKTDKSESGEKLYLEKIGKDSDFELKSYDKISISAYTELKPVMFMEGAVGSLASSTSLNTSSRMPTQFERGTNYAYFIRSNAKQFKSSVSDNENAYIIRGDEVYPINIDAVLYDSSFKTDLIVQEKDILVVPFKQYFITVAGAVRSPGRYPYIPDRTYEYYVALAGGFVPMQNAFEAVTITDGNGKHIGKKDYITPESRIIAKSNHFAYIVSTYGAVIASIGTLITSILSLRTLLSAVKG